MRIGVIADKLTGANATGVRLLKIGFKRATVVFGGEVPTKGDFTVVGIDTDSRYCSATVAETRVLKT